MSEKEKKAIEHLKQIKSYGMIMGLKADKDIEKILNLIDKQQEEIEDLRIIADDIEEHNIVYTDTPEFEDRFISKDKIRDKIKELEDDKYEHLLARENIIKTLEELLGE